MCSTRFIAKANKAWETEGDTTLNYGRSPGIDHFGTWSQIKRIYPTNTPDGPLYIKPAQSARVRVNESIPLVKDGGAAMLSGQQAVSGFQNYIDGGRSSTGKAAPAATVRQERPTPPAAMPEIKADASPVSDNPQSTPAEETPTPAPIADASAHPQKKSRAQGRTSVVRAGNLELRVPQDGKGRFRANAFKRYQRSDRALIGALAEIHIQGVATRRAQELSQQLFGDLRCARAVSRTNRSLDEELARFANRRLPEEYPYLALEAYSEEVREDGVVQTQAVLVATGINADGRRCVLAVELADHEDPACWQGFLEKLRQRGLRGVGFVVSENHFGLKEAIAVVFPEADWQRCYTHFLRDALSSLPRNIKDSCLAELKSLYDRPDLEQARQGLAAWLTKWESKYANTCSWVEWNIEETFRFYRLPAGHQRHMRSTRIAEPINGECKRRVAALKIFPGAASYLRLVRALTAEIHEDWIEETRYLNMELSGSRESAAEPAPPAPDCTMVQRLWWSVAANRPVRVESPLAQSAPASQRISDASSRVTLSRVPVKVLIDIQNESPAGAVDCDDHYLGSHGLAALTGLVGLRPEIRPHL